MITSSVLDPARYPTFADSRSVADWLRPGAAPFSPYSGTQYFSAGADSTSYKRLGKTLDLTGRTAPKLNFKVSADIEPAWDWMTVEVRDVTTNPNSDAWTTLPEADTDGAGPDVSLTTNSTGDSCPEGLATDADAPHPFLLHYWSATCEPHGHDRHVERLHRLHRRLDGLERRPVRLRGQEDRPADLRHHRLVDPGPRRLGRRRPPVRRRHLDRVQRLRGQ